jgi:hypothetical protein
MKTFPDFTWEWIVDSCESFCEYFQNGADPATGSIPERQEGYIQTAKGLIAIIPKLREHPQLEKLVPMKSLMSLRWFPAEQYEINLYYEAKKDQYIVTTLKTRGFDKSERTEETVVPFNEVADEISTRIKRLSEEVT